MRIGILVNSDRHLTAITGLTQAAVKKGHEVEIFAMDTGTRLLTEQSFTALAALSGVTISFCDHSAQELAVGVGALSAEIACSSQYSNARMNHHADRMIVL